MQKDYQSWISTICNPWWNSKSSQWSSMAANTFMQKTAGKIYFARKRLTAPRSLINLNISEWEIIRITFHLASAHDRVSCQDHWGPKTAVRMLADHAAPGGTFCRHRSISLAGERGPLWARGIAGNEDLSHRAAKSCPCTTSSWIWRKSSIWADAWGILPVPLF